jgi:hypothetical protein
MTFAAAFPILQKLTADKGQRTLRLMCGCDSPHVPHEPSPQAREIELLDWSICPWVLLDGQHWRAIDALRRLAKLGIQPRGELAPWAVVALTGGVQ